MFALVETGCGDGLRWQWTPERNEMRRQECRRWQGCERLLGVGTMPAYPVPRASTYYITCDVTSKLRRYNSVTPSTAARIHSMAQGDAKICREAFVSQTS